MMLEIWENEGHKRKTFFFKTRGTQKEFSISKHGARQAAPGRAALPRNVNVNVNDNVNVNMNVNDHTIVDENVKKKT